MTPADCAPRSLLHLVPSRNRGSLRRRRDGVDDELVETPPVPGRHQGIDVEAVAGFGSRYLSGHAARKIIGIETGHGPEP